MYGYKGKIFIQHTTVPFRQKKSNIIEKIDLSLNSFYIEQMPFATTK